MDMFSKEINAIIKDVLSFETFTDVQKKAIPKIKVGENVLIVSPTGSGKTEAVMLPLLEKIIEAKEKNDGIKILYITPLKALNRDLFSRFIKICEILGISVDIRHGDTTAYQRRLQLKHPPTIMITTPETLQAILAAPKMRLALKNVMHVVIDEIHELVNNKRGAQLSIALERLVYLSGKNFQRIGLSATISNPEVIARFLVGINRSFSIVETQDGKRLDIKIEYPKPSPTEYENAKEYNIAPTFLAMINKILGTGESGMGTLCFVNTRTIAELISSRVNLIKRNKGVGIHHSSISKEHRVATEKAFKKKQIRLIISTSSLELGIDIGHIEQVIQIGSPRTATRLVQRVGRAQHRIGGVSKGLVIADSFDDIVETIAIIQHAKNNKIEETNAYYAAYDVLAHQIAGLLLEYNRLSVEEIFKIVKRAYPYRNIKYEEIEDIADFLSKSRIIFKQGEELSRKRTTREYYYESLSTIPDTKQYKILNSTDNKIVGVLDEEFVINKLSEGAQFIVGGRVWQVLEIKEDIVVVTEATENSDTEIARWIGENIPVPYSVAQDALKIRGKLIEIIENKDVTNNELVSVFPCLLPSTAEFLGKTIKKLIKTKEIIQTDANFILEREKEFVVLNTGLGTKGNNTLSLLLANLLAARIGTTVPYGSDAYRIFLKVPYTVSNKLIIDTLKSIDERFLEHIIYKILENTNLFYWWLFNILKRFGLLKKDASLTLSEIKRYYRMIKNPILVKETLSEIVFEKLDIALIKEILKKLKSGLIVIKQYTGEISPISKWALGFIFSNGKSYENITHEVIEKVYERLLSKKVVLTCMSCGNWSTTIRIKNISSEDLKCPKCGSRLIAVTKERSSILQQVYKKYRRGEELTKEEKKILKNGIQSANLVLSHGRKAILILAGKGIGSKTASRVIKEAIHLSEKDLVKRIIEYEKLFARTHQFWKN
ncbi:MAG: DEAD/DEAH box helicase [Candidatus Odinarchaeota archaeon]|nr:DEAD/DEAH box helicase [Candidatus Odinarchaeota archaeon]